MSGRDLSRKFKPVINFLVFLIGIFPDFLLSFFWDLFSIYSGKIFVGIRYVLLKSRAKSVGENIYIGKSVIFKNLKNLEIGNNVSIHDFCYLDAYGSITIGDNVSIAHNSTILSTDHGWEDEKLPIKYNKAICKRTMLGNDIWIGCGVRVLGGVEINDRVIVAAGAVVNKDISSYSLVGGVPAKFIKKI